ncbi:diguanylate cyclase (GGDEF)-like protein [Pacificibacter maritimus]|uniref:Diguanylate cyclase (GGDEF)-like protein n=1 Tax=Pacificibacter maritimus TaxID=762213 RepID=A0A3N4V4G6_9RHOB|nr:GGDEF domain-containing protein [Pacificibacter maritimus]RPE72017.1 diguanylate cyclase (GGDEF)-like protein [Pacificibacter maritimus]
MALVTQLEASALDRLMPMHLILDAQGIITKIGPTLCKLRGESAMLGHNFFDVFDLRDDGRKSANTIIPDDKKLYMTFKSGVSTPLKGIATPMANSTDMLLNLSFGISVVDAVHDYRLTAGDFAATDLAIEMLYLVEAKSAVLEETKQLNTRLQGAKVAAEEQAYTDTLTGLKNRRAMDHVLGRMIRAGVPFALMHIDLDYFKDVNDTLGHAAGDVVLQNVAKVLVDETRAEDLVARVGGDEFIVVMHKMTDADQLMKVAERIIAQLEIPVPFNDTVCRISGSVGITTTEQYDQIDAEQMMHNADTALYASKHQGRACANFYVAGMPTLADQDLPNAAARR